eukprot:TRINITY_DN76528_c0_g1_i1.p1 TRINITY_DN76528_c0_g1~~TRINITY_DN76528_c0_g1_i1.p1  ORF type:complete len:433 (+),score=77.37 TRINITY_DN76528_c0_g1_i1:216-1514(+)
MVTLSMPAAEQTGDVEILVEDNVALLSESQGALEVDGSANIVGLAVWRRRLATLVAAAALLGSVCFYERRFLLRGLGEASAVAADSKLGSTLPAVANLSARTGLPEIPELPDEDQAALVASCVITAVQASSYVGEATLAIRASTQTCTGESPAACSATVNGGILSILWVAEAIALMASECAPAENLQALCAADSTCFVADMAEIAASASGIEADCRLGMAVDFDSNSSDDSTPEDVKARQASCAFDVLQASSYLGGVALDIRDAAQSCKPDGLNKEVCSISVLDVIALIGWMGSYISFIINDCPIESSTRAACAASVTELIAGISSSFSCGMSLKYDCPQPGSAPSYSEPAPPVASPPSPPPSQPPQPATTSTKPATTSTNAPNLQARISAGQLPSLDQKPPSRNSLGLPGSVKRLPGALWQGLESSLHQSR